MSETIPVCWEKEQHITPHVVNRVWHAFGRLSCSSKQETAVCLEEVKSQMELKTFVVALFTSSSDP